jgi:hypothetical protein
MQLLARRTHHPSPLHYFRLDLLLLISVAQSPSPWLAPIWMKMLTRSNEESTAVETLLLLLKAAARVERRRQRIRHRGAIRVALVAPSHSRVRRLRGTCSSHARFVTRTKAKLFGAPSARR